MPVTLNHTIISARDRLETAVFFTSMLGLPAHSVMGHFAVVKVGETSLDFVDAEGEIASRHFAFLVSEAEFDDIFGRIKARGLDYWADPFRRQPGEINRWDDGRGVYWEDPNGHLLEILTRPYGSAGRSAQHPNPLLGEKAE